MVSKKAIFFGVLVIAIIVVLVFVFPLNNQKNVCKEIDDEALFADCESCSDAEDIIDCRDVVYRDFAFLRKDKSLCDNLIQEFRKRDCLMNFEKIIARGAFEPSESSDGLGGYQAIR
tara:strand:+ start:137 stop:487 length:351 start_codon:yes stop_codon:yes gene_type:complete